MKTKKYKQAEEFFTSNKNNTISNYFLACVYNESNKKLKKALELINTYLHSEIDLSREYVSFASAHSKSAEICKKLKDKKGALKHITQAIILAPEKESYQDFKDDISE